MPLVSLIIAVDTVELFTNASITIEPPSDAEHLAADPDPLEITEKAMRHTGADIYRPTPQTVDETFRGTHMEMTASPALEYS